MLPRRSRNLTIRELGPKSHIEMVFKAYFLNDMVSGHSGLVNGPFGRAERFDLESLNRKFRSAEDVFCDKSLKHVCGCPPSFHTGIVRADFVKHCNATGSDTVAEACFLAKGACRTPLMSCVC